MTTPAPRTSRIQQFFSGEYNLAQALAYPFQLLALQTLCTPFERLQVLRQCEPSIVMYRMVVGPEDLAFKSQASKAAVSQRMGYPALLHGPLTRNHQKRQIRIVEGSPGQLVAGLHQGLGDRPIIFAHP